MSDATPRPWKAEKRNWRNEPSKHDWYICGNIHEPDDLDEIGSATSVAIVVGNPTAGDIPQANAELIVKAVNLFDEMLALLDDAEHDIRQRAMPDADWLQRTRNVLAQAAKVQS